MIRGGGVKLATDKKDIIRQKMLEQQSEARVVRKIVWIVSVVLLLLIVLIGSGGYFYVKSALKPVNPGSKLEKKVDIPIGSSVSEIATVLQKTGIIKNAKVFKYYVKLKNEGGFKAGEYVLSPSMDVAEIVSRLKSGKVLPRASVKMTIPEGKQLTEIADIMANAVKQKDTVIMNKLNDRQFIKKLMAKYPDLLTNEILNSSVKYPLEGYLFPATYSFYKPNPSVEEMVTAMLDKTRSALAGYQNEIKQKKLTVHELLTMASLVEEEATGKTDRKKIASVFYNRIKKGMPLQTDPTVLYAEGKHKEKVFYKDLEVNSPFNTYLHAGLPPGPIANAGISSIEAALDPANTDYYYFLATPTGSIIFTKTLEEHNQEKAKYISNK
jgi:UPF0755 protein